jgi:hypothetical protein
MHLLISICLLFAPATSYAVIIETDCFHSIEQSILALDYDALVIFDVDLTLIIPDDAILGAHGEHYLWNTLAPKLLFSLGEETSNHLLSRLFLQRKVTLIHDKIPSVLEHCKIKNIGTIALTAHAPGPLGDIPSLIDWRIEELRQLGIRFDDSTFKTHFSFPECQGKGDSPVFKQGVLCSSDYPKGEVLALFLNKAHSKPRKIIFIDDSIKAIESVESTLEALGIEHLSFHYTAAKHLSLPLNKSWAKFQIKHLIKTNQWLSGHNALNTF